MRKKFFTIGFLTLLHICGFSQENNNQQSPINIEKTTITDDFENGVVSMNGKNGLKIATPSGDFVFKPFMLVQTAAKFNYYDDEGLDKAYNQDNVANSGFAIPYAVLGFTGKAFGHITFNLSINAAASGGSLLQQAWFDIQTKKTIAFRIGKFKTPFTHAYLTTLGETLLPVLPTSLTASVILPYSLNAVTPSIGTGFDLGAEIHGTFAKSFGYEVGIFNGNGAGSNIAGKTFSDDWHIPSLLYAGRLTFAPKGAVPNIQGAANCLDQNKWMLGVSTSLNVESENESTNDFRAGLEFVYLYHKLYVAAECYFMNVGFTKRQKIDESYKFMGGYAQIGYFLTNQLQAAARFELYERNGITTGGLLNMPAIGCNYFIPNCNLKLQTMYQYTGRTGHETQIDRDNDDLGMSVHSATVMLQYTF
ncbi:MAG: OprO/OprP family phosphate-selective porin [Bacteroidales bacterium]|nr:OprO/OprP family phosphate-selective porin [Bacteroidales bacterium]